MTHLLPKNEHPVDRAVRFGIGLIALSLTFWGPHTLWGLLGLVPLVTAFIGSCPSYTLIGVSTRASKATQHAQ
jgi:hypothetical protein